MLLLSVAVQMNKLKCVVMFVFVLLVFVIGIYPTLSGLYIHIAGSQGLGK